MSIGRGYLCTCLYEVKKRRGVGRGISCRTGLIEKNNYHSIAEYKTLCTTEKWPIIWQRKRFYPCFNFFDCYHKLKVELIISTLWLQLFLQSWMMRKNKYPSKILQYIGLFILLSKCKMSCLTDQRISINTSQIQPYLYVYMRCNF